VDKLAPKCLALFLGRPSSFLAKVLHFEAVIADATLVACVRLPTIAVLYLVLLHIS
jgi:hypothetical protein